MINTHEAFDKQLLSWERERDALHRRLQNPPVRTLVEPIQRGWKRHFVLSAEARHRPDTPVLAAILAEIDSVAHFWRRDFRPSRRAMGHGRRSLSTEQGLYAFSTDEWDRRAYPDAWRQYFRVECVPKTLVDQPRAVDRKFQPWMYPTARSYAANDNVFALAFRFTRLFELRIERNWLTHVAEVEPEIVRRHAEVDAYINQNRGAHRLDWLHGHGSNRWRGRDVRQRILHELACREMRAHLGGLDLCDAPVMADAMHPPRFFCVVAACRRRCPGFLRPTF